MSYYLIWTLVQIVSFAHYLMVMPIIILYMHAYHTIIHLTLMSFSSMKSSLYYAVLNHTIVSVAELRRMNLERLQKNMALTVILF